MFCCQKCRKSILFVWFECTCTQLAQFTQVKPKTAVISIRRDMWQRRRNKKEKCVRLIEAKAKKIPCHRKTPQTGWLKMLYIAVRGITPKLDTQDASYQTLTQPPTHRLVPFVNNEQENVTISHLLFSSSFGIRFTLGRGHFNWPRSASR